MSLGGRTYGSLTAGFIEHRSIPSIGRSYACLNLDSPKLWPFESRPSTFNCQRALRGSFEASDSTHLGSVPWTLASMYLNLTQILKSMFVQHNFNLRQLDLDLGHLGDAFRPRGFRVETNAIQVNLAFNLRRSTSCRSTPALASTTSLSMYNLWSVLCSHS
ncbi:hypothetical protein B0H16DRAFT_1703510, partial [Mycena metata]